jgi:ring-1,2-phenylacetyl-CoA epoxidase subunit PaaD
VSELAVQAAVARARSGGTQSVAPELDAATVRAALADVADPEIPVVSILDLGIVERIEVRPDAIGVELLPTFVGCPALELIRDAVEQRLGAFGRPVEVRFGYRVPWSSDRITSEGRARLAAAGIAPPTPVQPGQPVLVQLGQTVPCPHCGSTRTVLENAFGATQCRAIHHCLACRQPFERFKPI